MLFNFDQKKMKYLNKILYSQYNIEMNRYIIESVICLTNNKTLFQILNLTKIQKYEYILPKIIKFKRFIIQDYLTADYDIIEYHPSSASFRYLIDSLINNELLVDKNSVELIIWFHKFNFFNKLLDYAVVYNITYINLLKWVIRNNSLFSDSIFKYIFRYWVSQKDTPLYIIKLFYPICINNNNTLSSEFFNFNRYYFNVVINGRLDILKFIYLKRSIIETGNIFRYAIEYEQLHIIKWIHKLNCKENQNQYIAYYHSYSPTKGNLPILKWLYHHNYVFKFNYTYVASIIHEGSLDIIIFIHENILNTNFFNNFNSNDFEICGIELNPEITNLIHYAVEYNQLKVAKWLYENRPELHKDWDIENNEIKHIIRKVSEKGDLDFIKIIHKNNPTTNQYFTTDAIDNAAQNGHLDIVKYLYENRKGQNDDGFTIYALHNNKHTHVVNYLNKILKNR